MIKHHLINILFISLSALSLAQQNQDISVFDSFIYKDFTNGTRIPVELKEGITLDDGNYSYYDSLISTKKTITIDLKNKTIEYGIYYYGIDRTHDNIPFDTYQRFVIIDGDIVLFEEYHNNILFAYFTYKSLFKNSKTEFSGLQITNNIDANEIFIIEQKSNSLRKGKIYKYGVLITQGNYCNNKKEGKWKIYNLKGKLIKIEKWKNDILESSTPR